MSHCLFQTAFYSPNLPSSRFSHLRRPPRSLPRFPIKAAAADARECLDHLERENKKKKTAPLGLWDRFPSTRTVQDMIEAMERMMEDPSSYNATWQPPIRLTDAVTYGRGRTPWDSWEIKEAEAEYRLRFDMPGMTKEDVRVWVEEKLLLLKAEKQPKKPSENDNGRRRATGSRSAP